MFHKNLVPSENNKSMFHKNLVPPENNKSMFHKKSSAIRK